MVAAGCSTKKNRLINRAYHNTTAHYNGYFNAREAVKWAIIDFEDDFEDDYSEVLPVYRFPNKEEAPEMYPTMDLSIEKCSKVIDKHSMYIQRKERNRWIDDCFFLIGKSHFYKREFVKAQVQFDYLAKEYKKDDDIKYNSMIWLARCAIESDQMGKADRLLTSLSKDADMPSEYRGRYHIAHAHYFLVQKNYNLAIAELKEAADRTKKKKLRARYLFILAQLYQETENDAQAMEVYQQVVKLNPSYEMTFYAKISQALAFDVGSGNFQETKELLEKLAADEKNEDYLDQIYYALGEMELREGRVDDGIEHLQASLLNNSRNDKLKVKTYLRLGEYFYEQPEYIPAAAYYDSAYQKMDDTYPDFYRIESLALSLGKVAKDITTFETQDSLLTIAGLPDDEREDFVESLRFEAEALQAAEKRAEQQKLQDLQERRASQKTFTKKGNFYFSNPGALSFGRKDFAEIWGDRPLEDNWRRKNRRSAVVDDFLEELEEEETAAADSLAEAKAGPSADDPTKTEFYTKGLPLTPEAKSAAHNLIIEALYDAGVVFMDEIKDDWMAIENFTELVTRYDTCRHTPDAYYRMYKLYEKEGNIQKAAECKIYILNNHPLSVYSKILINPDYFAEQAALKSEMDDAYEFAYTTFKEEQYRETISLCRDGLLDFKESKMEPKFALLKALAMGKTRTRDILRVELTKVMEEFKGTEEGDKAAEYLKVLGGPISLGELKEEQEEKRREDLDIKVVYEFDSELKHHFVLLIPNKKMKISDVKTAISNFNKKSFRNLELTINATFLDLSTQMVAVKGFEDNVEAMDYFRAFIGNTHDLKAINESSFTNFVISSDNFGRFYKDKDSEYYLEFFQENYQP